MLYEVKYRKDSFGHFWKKIKRVKGDGLMPDSTHRYFILDDDSRLEVPMKERVFVFPKGRALSIESSMAKESGQAINVVSK